MRCLKYLDFGHVLAHRAASQPVSAGGRLRWEPKIKMMCYFNTNLHLSASARGQPL